MFKNIGKEIILIAQISFWTISAFCVIYGFVLAYNIPEELFYVPLIIMFVGPVVTYISMLLVFGFAELLYNVYCLKVCFCGKDEPTQTTNLTNDTTTIVNKSAMETAVSKEENNATENSFQQ